MTENSRATTGNQIMLISAILSLIFVITFVIGVALIYTLKNIGNKNNCCAICLTSLFTLLLICSSAYFWGYNIKFQNKVINAQKTKDCEDYSEWLLIHSPTVEWAITAAGLVSAYILIILSIAGLFKYKPKENKILFPSCIIASITWLFSFLILHKFNQCQLKRYINNCTNVSGPV